ncbi:unnamed protein product [Psylliodes chrysocephalus]|uniref:Uncharacterized protein n=1 Tax=Psylliodes chrysocephalus TaxID=3402493 RepID=A0A9P0GEA4_9CUCU|nr:unnamed protein product [Psylliodes chrysocephala]
MNLFTDSLINNDIYDNPNDQDSEYEEESEFQESESETEEVIEEPNYNNFLVVTIRQLARKLQKSEQLLVKFRTCCETANIDYLMPVVDIRTRWNSTLQMLSWALACKSAKFCATIIPN